MAHITRWTCQRGNCKEKCQSETSLLRETNISLPPPCFLDIYPPSLPPAAGGKPSRPRPRSRRPSSCSEDKRTEDRAEGGGQVKIKLTSKSKAATSCHTVKLEAKLTKPNKPLLWRNKTRNLQCVKNGLNSFFFILFWGSLTQLN